MGPNELAGRFAPEQIAALRASLRRRGIGLRTEIRELLRQSDEQHHRDLAGMVSDEGDESVANLLTDIEAAFIDRHVSELREVELAAANLEGGCYGVCEKCGRDIEYERLTVMPAATRRVCNRVGSAMQLIWINRAFSTPSTMCSVRTQKWCAVMQAYGHLRAPDQRRHGMSVGEICNRDVVFAPRDTTVQAAAKLMRHYHVGSLVVVDEASGGRVPAGIVTDRDIVIEVDAVELDPKVITVGDIMAPELVTVAENQGVLETLEVMRAKGVRRMPVVDRAGHLAGIVTVDDLLEVLAEELTDLTRIVSKEQAREAHTRK